MTDRGGLGEMGIFYYAKLSLMVVQLATVGRFSVGSVGMWTDAINCEMSDARRVCKRMYGCRMDAFYGSG